MSTKKSKTIFDDDAVLVEQTYPEDDVEVTVPVKTKRSAMSTKDIDVSDVLDTFAAYSPQRFGINDPGNGAGECMICGTKTQYRLRKFCADCMDKYGREMHDKAKDCIGNGETYFTMNTNG